MRYLADTPHSLQALYWLLTCPTKILSPQIGAKIVSGLDQAGRSEETNLRDGRDSKLVHRKHEIQASAALARTIR